MDTDRIVTEFFADYARALLDRDGPAVARRYAVPALILFPGQSIPVADQSQTEQFFGAAFAQYEGVTDTSTDITVRAATEHSVWADVTWHHRHGDEAASEERMMYQLVAGPDGWQIAVLTPLDPADSSGA